jgi:hypothetical protein
LANEFTPNPATSTCYDNDFIEYFHTIPPYFCNLN